MMYAVNTARTTPCPVDAHPDVQADRLTGICPGHPSDAQTGRAAVHPSRLCGGDADADSASVTPCFTPGAQIATARGAVRIEDLRIGDKVITRDNGLQDIRWIGSKRLNGRQLLSSRHLRPVLVRQGALGGGLPTRDMLLSPNHRVLVASDQTQLYFEEREVLCAAKHLVNHRGIHDIQTLGVTYYHFLCDRHEVILSDGAWTESFQPGDFSLRGIGNAQRQEILELFPSLANRSGLQTYMAARRVLSKKEAQRLTE